MARWIFLMSVGVLGALAAVGTSVDAGTVPDLPAAFRARLTTLLDLKAGPLAGTGAVTVDAALQQLHSVAADHQASTADRLTASATLAEARRLTGTLERTRRCHRFFHEPKAQWAMCCSLAGSGDAKTIDGASMLCLELHTVGIAAPAEAPVLGRDYVHTTNPLKSKTVARVGGGASAVAASPAVAARQTTDVPLPVGDSFEGEFAAVDDGPAAYDCLDYQDMEFDPYHICSFFCCHTLLAGTAMCEELLCI